MFALNFSLLTHTPAALFYKPWGLSVKEPITPIEIYVDISELSHNMSAVFNDNHRDKRLHDSVKYPEISHMFKAINFTTYLYKKQ